MNPIQDNLLESYKCIKHGFFKGFDSNGKSLNVNVKVGNNAIANRTSIANYFGIDISNLIILNQIHSDIVHVITNDNIDQYKFSSIENELNNEGDAIITNIPNILIGVNTADCAPILLYDCKKQYIAAIHSGWRGTIGNIIESTLNKLRALGCKNILAVIGPCIAKENLILNKSLIPSIYHEQFTKNLNNLNCTFDMIGVIVNKLQNSKIVNKISVVNINTFTDKYFYSYRRANQVRKGAQFSGIMLTL